ncbi:hypothetical protein OIU76_003843 [Salix suchowensis]|nr:hypothetical protein OIU78_013604 [Salix suchowensis]KAJ6347227.1 hypothetical protein OIU76_003843 [Salix suchowensis]
MPASACSSSFIALLVLLPEQDMAYCHEPNWVQFCEWFIRRLAFSSALSNPEASFFLQFGKPTAIIYHCHGGNAPSFSAPDEESSLTIQRQPWHSLWGLRSIKAPC